MVNKVTSDDTLEENSSYQPGGGDNGSGHPGFANKGNKVHSQTKDDDASYNEVNQTMMTRPLASQPSMSLTDENGDNL